MKIAILGGGIAGLTAGRLLHEKGYEITLFEALPQIGGLCRTKKLDNGFLFDIGGGHIFHSVYPKILQQMVGYVGEENLYRHKRNTRIYIYDTFIKYPFENGLNDLPPDVRFECLMGYINAWYKNGNSALEFKNFREMIYAIFGAGIANHFMIPYNTKIWCVDPVQMGLDWIKNRVPRAPLEDVVKSALGISTEGYKHQAQFYYPKQGGVQTFIDAVAKPIRGCIKTNTPVKSIAKKESKWEVNDEIFDRVVSTIPLDRFCEICDAVPPDVKEKAKKLQHLSLLSVLICLKTNAILPYSWIYLPHETQSEANRLTYFSNYSRYLCPDGKTSLLCEATYLDDGTVSISEQRVKKMVTQLIQAGLVNESDILSLHWETVPYAYILPDCDMAENRAYIMERLKYPNLDFLGRFGSFQYYNIDQVIKQVNELVESRF